MAESVIIDFVADPSGLQPAYDALKAIGAITAEQAAAFKKANADYAARIAISKQQTAAINDTVKAEKSLLDTTKQLSQVILTGATKDEVATIKKWGDEMLQTAEKSKSLKTQLREAKAELAAMEAAGQDTTQRFIDMSVAAAKLEDQISDTNERIRQMASDTRKIDLAVEAVRGIAAAFAVAQGAAALFGEENEEIQKALLKVQAATAVLMGTQELANLVTKKGGIATVAYGYALVAVDRISKVTGLSMAASWAVATGGITLLIAGVVSLIAYINSADEATSAFADKKLADDAANAQAQQELQQSIYDRLKEQDAEFRAELDRQRKDYILRNVDSQTAEYNMLSQIVEKYNNRLESYARGEQTIELTKERETEIRDIIRDATLARNAIQKDADEKRIQDATAAFEKLKKIELSKKVDAVSAFYLPDKKVDLEIKELTIKPDEIKMDKVPEVEFKFKASKRSGDELFAQFQNEYAKALPYINAYAAALDSVFAAAQEGVKRKADAELSYLDSLKEKELRNKKLTAEQKDAIDEKYRKKEAEIKRRAFESQKQAAIIQAIMNTALAIVNALATAPTIVAGIALAAAAGITGATQIALIASQPVPKFEKGGKNIPRGMKMVGEKGPELMWTPGGETIIPHADTEKLLKAWGIPAMPNVNMKALGDAAIGKVMPAMDYSRMEDAVTNALRKSPMLNVNLDKNGYTIHQIKKGRIVEVLNSYYNE